MKTIVNLSRLLRPVVLIIIGCCLICAIIIPFSILHIQSLTTPLKIAWLAYFLTALGIELWANILLWTTLDSFMKERIFESSNARKLKTTAYLKGAGLMLSPLAFFAPDINILGKIIDFRNSISAGDFISDFVFMFMFLLIAFIMEEACRLKEEGKLVI